MNYNVGKYNVHNYNYVRKYNVRKTKILTDKVTQAVTCPISASFWGSKRKKEHHKNLT